MQWTGRMTVEIGRRLVKIRFTFVVQIPIGYSFYSQNFISK